MPRRSSADAWIGLLLLAALVGFPEWWQRLIVAVLGILHGAVLGAEDTGGK